MPGRPLCGESVTFTILPPRAVRDHRLRRDRVGHQPGALDVQADHGAKALRRDVLGRRQVLAAGVVHEHVDPAVALEHPVDERSTWSSSRMSQASASQRRPRAPRDGLLERLGRRPQTTTRAPSAASSSAVARPRPVPPPVTSATWPSSRPGAKSFEGMAPEATARREARAGSARAAAQRLVAAASALAPPPPARSTAASVASTRSVGLGQLGEAGRLVHRVADHGVLVALLGADVAGDDPAGGHADAGVEPRARARAARQPAGGPRARGGGVGLGGAGRRRRARRRPRTC